MTLRTIRIIYRSAPLRDFASSPRQSATAGGELFRALQLSWPDRCWSDDLAKFEDGSPHCAFSLLLDTFRAIRSCRAQRWARTKPEGAHLRYATIDDFDLDLVPRKIVDELQQDWSNRFAKLADAILQRLVSRCVVTLSRLPLGTTLGRQDGGTHFRNGLLNVVLPKSHKAQSQ
jgi:hypothetical protein